MTTSTNDVVKEQALSGAPEGLAVLAERQEHGRGRQGRSWQSPKGSGLYLSVLLRPDIPAYEANWLGIVGALGVLSALESAGVGDLTLKWPNDVLARGLKIAGILVEPRIGDGRVEFAVLGIGVNIVWSVDDLARAGLARATSCRIEGLEITTAGLSEAILDQLDDLYRQFQRGVRQPLLLDWSRRTGRADLPVLE